MKISDINDKKTEDSKLNKQSNFRMNKSTVDNHLHQLTNLHNTNHNLTNQKEMQELLSKLKEMIPNMPKNKKLTKLEIIQNVIDYIFDLETALESHSRNLSNRVIINNTSNQLNSLKPCNNSSHSHHHHHNNHLSHHDNNNNILSQLHISPQSSQQQQYSYNNNTSIIKEPKPLI